MYRLLRKLLIILAVFASFITLSTPAAEQRELRWDDLVPKATPFDDPFAQLSPDQLSDLAIVARTRRLQARQNYNLPATSIQKMQELTEKLEKQGIDIDSLLARRAEITKKRRAQAEAVVEDLNGQHIRIPGYLLPLAFDGTKVTEFLLVPYVGACIHVPPPPPNQIVHVSLEEGYEVRGLFSPVWVNGTMATEQRNSELSFVDGAADIAVGYSLKADQIEAYE